jgi:hypothetical protein
VTREINLNSLKAGINRLRIKGGADPSSLYDLLNGYVTIDGGVQSRPGTVEAATLPSGTLGLCAFNGGLVVFADAPVAGMPTGYTCEVLRYPNDPGDANPTLTAIHFAAPFLGHLYVVAEFSTGEVFHYWLLATGSAPNVASWQANHQYDTGDQVQPTDPNGFYYVVQAGPNDDLPLWQAGAGHATGDQVQPTVRMGYYATCTNTIGDNPKSGSEEPDWPDSDGAVVYEDGTDTGATTASTTPTAPTSDPGGDRYSNVGGSGGSFIRAGQTIKQF